MLVPKLNLESFTVKDEIDHSFIIVNKTQESYRLEESDTLFLRCIDGNKSIEDISNELEQYLGFPIPKESLWKALDILADIGILKTQLLPPSGGQVATRRAFLGKVASTLGIVAAAHSGSAYAQSEQDTKAAQAKEGAAKINAEQRAKGIANNGTEQADKTAQELKAKEAANNTTEQDAKKSQEQTTKKAQEQNVKKAQEQQVKGGTPANNGAEQAEKTAQELKTKEAANNTTEQNAKKSQEQNTKKAQEQNAKTGQEQVRKNSEAATKFTQETESKETSTKVNAGGGGTGGTGASTVNAPATLSLLALGATALGVAKIRQRIAKADSSESEEK